MTTPWDEQLELTLTSVFDVRHAGDLLDRLATAVLRAPLRELEVTLHLAELLTETVEGAWWDDIAYESADACAGVRVHGPLDLGGEFAWASAAAAVVDLVGRAEQAAGQYAPFGDALTGFNAEYDRLTRHVAIAAGRATAEDAGDHLPPEERSRIYPLLPTRSAVLRAGWSGGPRALPEAPAGHPIWGEVGALCHAWANGRRALATLIGFQRRHLAALPLRRIRAELEWEAARVAHVAHVAQQAPPGAGAGRKQPRPDPPPDEKQDARDKWLYELAADGELTYVAIVRRLKRLAPEHGWRSIGSIEGVRKAATRYAEVNGLPRPPARQHR